MRIHLKIFWVLLAILTMSQFNPQSSKITDKFFPEKTDLPEVTPGLKKQKGFTNYEELMDFLNNLVQQHPTKATLTFIGDSKKGLPIPLITLGTKSAEKKIKVWMQGGLHGDEPASTESLLYLLYELLNNQENAALLDKLEIAILPMANIDGYLKLERNNSEGLDLNRDQTKLMAAESALFKRAFASFKPHIALDFHEFRPFRKDFAKLSSFGVTSAYDVMFLYSGNLNVPKNLRDFTNENFLAPTRKLLDNNKLRHHDYFTTDVVGGDIHFNQGSVSARSSATNFALQNIVSTLVEVRGVGIGRTSFKRRVFTGFLIAKSYLDIAAANPEAVLNAIETAKKSQNQVVLSSSRNVSKGTLDFIDLEKNELLSLDLTIRDAWLAEAKTTRARPKAYLIDANQTNIIQKVEAYGIKVSKLTEPKSFEIEQYTVSNYQSGVEKFEKMTLQDVGVTLSAMKKEFPIGTFYISMNQDHANILPELFEPEAPNSFVSFGVLETKLAETLPIYRVLN